MASGKQLSFQHGEVAPTLHFKSDAVSYAQGVGKLTNMYVRRAGGVSNRPGLQFIKKHSNQKLIPAEGEPAGIKGFTFWDPIAETFKVVEYGDYGATADVDYGFSVDGAAAIFVSYGQRKVEPKPDKIKFTPIKEHLFISPPFVDIINQKINVALENNGTVIESNFGYHGTTSTGSVTITEVGDPPVLPVSYYVTATLKNGVEKHVKDFTDGSAYPHANKINKIVMNLTTPVATHYGDVKYFNFYRAAGEEGVSNSFYKLVGRVKYNGTATQIKFSDYGADDPSQTPPLDDSFLNNSLLTGAGAAAYYQQRLVCAMKPGATDTIKAGDLIASKIGAPEQLTAPVIYTDTGAFQFSIPVTDGTPCIALLAMERLIAFTSKGVYVVRGGEQGILTPTQVNPLLVSEEGCSTTVEPKMAGRRGYFMNYSHSKLMAIEFGVDGNLTVFEASLFSDHLIAKDIVQMEVVTGEDNTVYLLRRDGKLVRATVTDDGIHGFALMETEGYIESIFKGKARKLYIDSVVDEDLISKYYDVLMCYVIVDGVRTLQRMGLRDDVNREGEFFADSFQPFGFRRSRDGNNGYYRLYNIDGILSGQANITSDFRVNIPAGQASYGVGDTVFIDVNDPDELGFGGFFIYYYSGGQILFEVLATPDVASGDPDFPTRYEAVFSEDVPAELIDVAGSSMTQTEKNYASTNWVPATNKIYIDSDLVDVWGLASAAKELSIVADGEVISSPLNPHKNTLSTELDGSDYIVDLGEYFGYGYYGLPYTSEFETLDIETADNRTLTDSNKIINAVGVGLYETRGGFYGIPDRSLENMEELVSREEENFSLQTENFTGHLTVNFPTEYTKSGRVNFKQVDPSPVTILAVYPKGISGD
jgi:hypothetical protein